MVHGKPTKYSGVQFRSRTESKYCMLFNMFDEPWTYESKRFNLPSGSYLPDFFLFNWNMWIEIKGPYPTIQEQILCQELHLVTKQAVAIAYGWPPTILLWSNGSWVKGPSFGLLHMKLVIGGKPIPVSVYNDISQKIWSQHAAKRKRVRTPSKKKR